MIQKKSLKHKISSTEYSSLSPQSSGSVHLSFQVNTVSPLNVYNFDGVYEITRTPGQAEKATLYFKGLYGDIFSQMTRNDAQLVSDNGLTNGRLPNGEWLVKTGKYFKNRVSVYYLETIVSLYRSISDYRLLMIVAVMFVIAGYGLLLLNEEIKLIHLPTPIILTSYILLFASCGNFSSNKKGEAPWLLLANGINAQTPTVDQPQNGNGATSSGGSGGASAALVPPTGMFFLHPDHLGSVNMITDGFGNLITGGNNGGKSSINYKPYGEIHRTDSGGPDVSKFKYTGQEEDKESGLMYYKARYYDPALGRFLQADSVVMPEATYGLNRYMYTFGNPVKFGDRGGNKPSRTALFAIAMHYHKDAIAQSGVDPNIAYVAGMYSLRGGKNPGKDTSAGLKLGDYKNYTWENAAGGLRWASGGLKQAADTFNKAIGADYEKRKRINFAETCGVGGIMGGLTTLPKLFYSFGQGAAGSAGSGAGVIGFGKVAAVAAIGCVMYSAGVHLGAQGYGENLNENLGLIGFGVDGLDDAGVLKGKSGLAASSGLWYQLGIFGLGLNAGNRIHERNKNHRAMVNAFNCFRIADAINGEDGNIPTLGAISCLGRFQGETK